MEAAGKGDTATLYVDGKQVEQGRIEQTHAFISSADSVTEVGNKTGADRNEFTGKFGGFRSTWALTATITYSLERNDIAYICP